MKRRMTLGDFVVAYLRKIGVSHVFGIPGDLALKLFFTMGRKHGLKMHTLSHEPGVGFAADGYARATGKIGVVCVTYGAGGHNMVNPVAGSFSERVPVLVFSGGPGEGERKLGTLTHHQARDLESQQRIYREVTCAQTVLTDPRTAAEQMHEVVKTVWAEQRPGYIEIHRDMVDREIEVPPELIAWDGTLEFLPSDPRKVEEAARETGEMFNASRKPLLVAGIEIHRYKLARELITLAERMGAPVLTTVLGKGAFPMDHPLFMGVQVADISAPSILARMKEADLTINLGCLKTDMNFCNQPPNIVHELLKQEIRTHHEEVHYGDNLNGGEPAASDNAPLRVRDMLREVNRFLAGHPNYGVVTESGDMLFAGLDIRVPNGGLYLAQGFYASMGFAVPAAMGTQIGTGVRPLIMCGDGAFQMTGPEISHAPILGTNPIVIVVNNSGWQIFRPIADRPELLEIPPWPYAKLAESWGGAGFVAGNLAELRSALEAAHAKKSFAIIEARVAVDDLSPVTVKYIQAAATRSQAPASTNHHRHRTMLSPTAALTEKG
jgi:TPP-dependent 2-oxoacid decarboxylase